MANLTIRNLEDPVKARLRLRAARNGRSMEEEARVILRSAVAVRPGPSDDLADAIHRRFSDLGGLDLPDLPREPTREPPRFD